MTRSFRDQIPPLVALAAQYLGWRPSEFWSATPEELRLALSDPARDAGQPLTMAELQHMLERESDRHSN